MASVKLAAETEAAPGRGFPGLRCPCCGEEGGVHLHLDDVTGPEAFSCADCENTFGVEDVRAMLAGWTRVLAWVDLAPPVEG